MSSCDPQSVGALVRPVSHAAGHVLLPLLFPLPLSPPLDARAKRNDTQISGNSSPGGKGEEEQTYRDTVKAHIEEDRTGSRLTCEEKEGVERSKERGNDGRAIEGRGTMERSGVTGKGGRMI